MTASSSEPIGKYSQQELLAAIIMYSDDAIVGKTLDGIIETWNSGAELLYGYSAQEVIGKSVSIIIPKDRQDELNTFLEKIKRGERVEHHETKRVRKDGVVVDVSVSLSPIRDKSGTVCGAAAIARDITVQKKIETELIASNSELTAKVDELKKMNDLMVDRELTMVGLKNKIAVLESNSALTKSLPTENII
jgi:PAS domain S-box-containing protein